MIIFYDNQLKDNIFAKKIKRNRGKRYLHHFYSTSQLSTRTCSFNSGWITQLDRKIVAIFGKIKKNLYQHIFHIS